MSTFYKHKFEDLKLCQLKKDPTIRAKDEKLSIEDTQNIVNTLREAGAKVDFTVFPEGNHFIADEVYSNPTLQQWLSLC